MTKRVTDWQTGDVVRTTREIRCITKPSWPLPAGTLAHLGRLQRVQDGIEMWSVWMGALSYGACHVDLERAAGPVLWRSCFYLR